MKGAVPSQPSQAFPELDIEGVPVPVSKPSSLPAAEPEQEADAGVGESVRATVAFGQKQLGTVTIPDELLEGLSGEERLAVARQIALKQQAYQQYAPASVSPGGWLEVEGVSRRPRDDALFIPAQNVAEAGFRWDNIKFMFISMGLTIEVDFERDGYILRRGR